MVSGAFRFGFVLVSSSVVVACATSRLAGGPLAACGPALESIRADVERVDTKVETTRGHLEPETRVAGAVVHVRPTRGESSPALARALRCEGVSVDAFDTSDGFAIAMTSSDDASAQDILRRARALVATR